MAPHGLAPSIHHLLARLAGDYAKGRCGRGTPGRFGCGRVAGAKVVRASEISRRASRPPQARPVRALSSISDLTANNATTTMLVNVLILVGQFQRDLQNELTREGLAAARSRRCGPGAPLPRRAARGVRAGPPRLSRRGQHRGAGPPSRFQPGRELHRRRRPVAGSARPPRRPVAATEAVRVEIPGQIAAHFTDHDGLAAPERQALRRGRRVRRGQGYSLTSPYRPRSITLCSPPPSSPPRPLLPPTARPIGFTPNDSLALPPHRDDPRALARTVDRRCAGVSRPYRVRASPENRRRPAR